MSIEIGGGITIGPGITIKGEIGPDSIRSALSASAQIAYDAATEGNFISVSAADYAAVAGALTGVRKLGDSDANATFYSAASYTGTCAALNNPGSSNVDTGYYIIGFLARHFNTSNTHFRLLISGSARGTYIQLGNNAPVVNANAVSYFIRKAPNDANVAAQYVGIVSNTGSFRMSNTTWANGAFDCSEPYSTWSFRNGTQPVFQALTVATKQW
jgi:hypothetical protein